MIDPSADPSGFVEELSTEIFAQAPAAFVTLVMGDDFLQAELMGLKIDAENGLRAVRRNEGTVEALGQALKGRKTAILRRLPEGASHFTVEKLLAGAVERLLDAARGMAPPSAPGGQA